MSSVLVLAGGSSEERDVSLRSGKAVAEALRAKQYDVTELDPADNLSDEQLKSADVVFPVLHGAGGEDGILQKRLEDLGISFVGSGSASSTLCFDKWRYKELLQKNDFPTSSGELVDKTSVWESAFLKKPFVLKPYDGGSSIDNYICRDISTLDRSKIEDIFTRHPTMLLEELIQGDEITLSVLGDKALPAIEIIPPPSGEFDYDNKYNGQSQELCPPVHVSEAIQQKARAMAEKIHALCSCRDFSRTDMMIDANGSLFVLETNTIPGMTNQSLFPKAAATGGVPMEDLVDRLVQYSLKRKTT